MQFPNIKSDAIDLVNIRGTSHFVMAEDAWLKKDANYVLALALRIPSEKIKHVFQLASELGCYHRIAWR